MDPFIGQIMMFAGNFAPRGWALCNGQLLSISQNTALFSILGTTYGGDGQTTFGLPDLRGRGPIHSGQGPGLSNRVLGQKAGAETVTLTPGQMPSHNHGVSGAPLTGTLNDPTGAFPAEPHVDNATKDPVKAYGANASAQMNADMIGQTGGDEGHPNMQPFIVINYVIALVGIFPSRN